MIAKCGHCPRTGGCLGQLHRRTCDKRNPSHPAYDTAWLKPLPTEDGFEPDQPAPPQPEAEQSSTVPLTVSVAVVRCDHRTKLPACGCAGKWRCERDQADVTWGQCIACKTAEAEATP